MSWLLTNARYGQMFYLPNDVGAGANIQLYGECGQNEIDFLHTLIKPGDTVLDVGANHGMHTLAFANFVGPEGTVFAFEPQTIMSQILCANVIINRLTNVKTYNLPVSNDYCNNIIKIPELNPEATANFGGLSLTDYAPTYNYLPSIRIDDLKLSKCDLMKIDVEGHEWAVLLGATDTIAKYKPILYMENNRPEQAQRVKEFLEFHGYAAYHHLPPSFNPNNFKGVIDNPFHGGYLEPNMVCVDRTSSSIILDPKWLGPRIL